MENGEWEDLALEPQRHKVTNYLALSPTGRLHELCLPKSRVELSVKHSTKRNF